MKTTFALSLAAMATLASANGVINLFSGSGCSGSVQSGSYTPPANCDGGCVSIELLLTALISDNVTGIPPALGCCQGRVYETTTKRQVLSQVPQPWRELSLTRAGDVGTPAEAAGKYKGLKRTDYTGLQDDNYWHRALVSDCTGGGFGEEVSQSYLLNKG
ncbi:hypothetical protein CIB48_g4218 [Xylaria polymorpha]|nr:hypothetical protein CIB48_g4218 [Xylaria polymorpha]